MLKLSFSELKYRGITLVYQGGKDAQYVDLLSYTVLSDPQSKRPQNSSDNTVAFSFRVEQICNFSINRGNQGPTFEDRFQVSGVRKAYRKI